MVDKVDVQNWPEGGSKERVAFDLMEKISGRETDITRDRSYWLSLYAECLQVVRYAVSN